MSEQSTKAVGSWLKIGFSIFIEGESQAAAGIVLTTSRNKLGLELSKHTSAPFSVGERVLIKSWDKGDVLHCWSAEVITVTGFKNQQMVVSILDHQVERRKFRRFKAAIPFFFTIVEATETSLIGRKVASETKNIGVGGLLFETALPIKVGDKLSGNLQLGPSQQVNACGWVVRTESVERKEYMGSIVVRSFNSVALEFLQLEQDDQIQLLRFLLHS